MTNYAKLKNDPDPGKKWLSLICDINTIRFNVAARDSQRVRDLFNELAPHIEDSGILKSLRTALLLYASGHTHKATTQLQVLIASLARKIPPIPGFRHPLHTQN